MKPSRATREDGSASVFSFFVLLLVMMLGLGVTMYTGRYAQMQESVQAAAEDAARAGTQRQLAGSSEFHIERTVEHSLRGRSVPCHSLTVNSTIPRTPGNNAEVRRGGTIRVDVRCDLLIEDLTFVTFLPRAVQIRAIGRERVDVYRGTTG